MDSCGEREEFSEFKVAHLHHGPVSCRQEAHQKAPRESPGLWPDGKAITVAVSLYKYKNTPQARQPPCHNNCNSHSRSPSKPVFTTEK